MNELLPVLAELLQGTAIVLLAIMLARTRQRIRRHELQHEQTQARWAAAVEQRRQQQAAIEEELERRRRSDQLRPNGAGQLLVPNRAVRRRG